MACILVIDDDRSIFHAIEVTLDPPHYVMWAQDVPRARQVIRDVRPDLIILDYLLGETATIPTFLAELRHTLPFTPIMILTAFDSAHVAAEAFRSGADDFLGKPFDADVLQQRVASLLAGRRPNPPEAAE
jgi:DNA-binding response OmpR family regulator